MGKAKGLKRGPWTVKDVKRVLEHDGWTHKPGNHHIVWEHPRKKGKFATSEAWTSLRITDPILKGMVRTCEISKQCLLEMLNQIYDLQAA